MRDRRRSSNKEQNGFAVRLVVLLKRPDYLLSPARTRSHYVAEATGPAIIKKYDDCRLLPFTVVRFCLVPRAAGPRSNAHILSRARSLFPPPPLSLLSPQHSGRSRILSIFLHDVILVAYISNHRCVLSVAKSVTNYNILKIL